MSTQAAPAFGKKEIGSEQTSDLALVIDEHQQSHDTLVHFFQGVSLDVLHGDSVKAIEPYSESRACRVKMMAVSTTLANMDSAQSFFDGIFKYFPFIPILLIGDGVSEMTDDPSEGVFFFDRLTRPIDNDALHDAYKKALKFSNKFRQVRTRQLFRSQNEVLEEPIARIIHDLNNQITGLKGGVDLMSYSVDMMQDPESQYKLKRYMDQFIVPSMEQIEQMVRNWRRIREKRLRFARNADLVQLMIRAIQMSCNPVQIECVHLFVNGDEVVISEDHDGYDIFGMANPSQFVLGMAYIVQNALEAIEADDAVGKIHIEVNKAVDGMCAVRIFDNGSGISESERNLIWRSFYTTKENTNTGLGLSIAKQVIDKVQGQISCIASPLSGAGIEVLIPVADEEITSTDNPSPIG